eukprot:3022371-Rhodomonas_salina.9
MAYSSVPVLYGVALIRSIGASRAAQVDVDLGFETLIGLELGKDCRVDHSKEYDHVMHTLSPCSRGYDGKACSACAKGFVRSPDGECDQCPRAHASLFVFATLPVFAAWGAIAWLHWRREESHVAAIHWAQIMAMVSQPASSLVKVNVSIFHTAQPTTARKNAYAGEFLHQLSSSQVVVSSSSTGLVGIRWRCSYGQWSSPVELTWFELLPSEFPLVFS